MKMTPKDIFGIIIRFAGLFMLRLSLWLFYDLTAWYYPNSASSYRPTSSQVSDPKVFLLWGIGYLAIGIYLLAGAPQLLQFSYPEPESPDSGNEHREEAVGSNPATKPDAGDKMTTCFGCKARIPVDSEVCPRCGIQLY